MSQPNAPPGWNLPVTSSTKMTKNQKKRKRKNKQSSKVTDQSPASEPDILVTQQAVEASSENTLNNLGASKVELPQSTNLVNEESSEPHIESCGVEAGQQLSGSLETTVEANADSPLDKSLNASNKDSGSIMGAKQDDGYFPSNTENLDQFSESQELSDDVAFNDKEYEERIKNEYGTESANKATLGEYIADNQVSIQSVSGSNGAKELGDITQGIEGIKVIENVKEMTSNEPEPYEKHGRSSESHHHQDQTYPAGSSHYQPPAPGMQHPSNRRTEELERANSYQTDNRYNEHDNRGQNQARYDGYPHQNRGTLGRGSRGRGRIQTNWSNNHHRDGHYQNNQSFHNHGNGGDYNNQYNQGRGSHSYNHYARNGQGHGRYSHNQMDYSSFEYPGDMEVSKELVRIVRHGKYKWIKMDQEGYVAVDDVINDPKFIRICSLLTLENIKALVNSNDKKRFELKEMNGKWFIKATQGHTIQVENLALTPITDPAKFPNIFHGTYFESWEFIKKTGLNRMKRNHIHFAIGLPGNESVISGMRSSAQVAIELDIAKAMEAGLKFFLSSNNVVLSEGNKTGTIHPKFFKRVLQLRPTLTLLHFDVPTDATEKPLQVKGSEKETLKKTAEASSSKSEKVKDSNKPKIVYNEPEFVMPTLIAEQPKKSYPPGYTPGPDEGSNKKKKKKNKH